MNRTSLLIATLSVFPALTVNAQSEHKFREFDSPVNYNYFKAFAGWGLVKPDDGVLSNEDVTELGIGYYRMLSQNWIFDFDYEGRFIHANESDLRNDRASIGGRYRYSLSEKSDLLFGGKIGAMRSKSKQRGTARTLSFETDVMFGVNLGYRYGFSENFEAGFDLEYLDASHWDEIAVTANAVYYRNQYLGFGVYVSEAFGDGSDTFESGVEVKFRF